MKIYPVQTEHLRHLVHIDAYRLSSALDVESIGLSELMLDPANLIVVEWPENIWELIKGKSRKMTFKFITETEREIDF